MAPPRATRGGAAAADAARDKARAEQERADRARAALVVGEVDVVLDSHLLVDKDKRVHGRAKHHAKTCHELAVRGPASFFFLLFSVLVAVGGRRKAETNKQNTRRPVAFTLAFPSRFPHRLNQKQTRRHTIQDDMEAAIAALEGSVRAHLIRQDGPRASAAREHLREVLLARRRLRAQAEALDAIAQATGGGLHFQCDKKLKPRDWRAKVDERVAAAMGAAGGGASGGGGGWRVDREPELLSADKLARLAKVKLHAGMADEESDSDGEGGNDAGGGGAGGGDDSDDSGMRVEQRGPLRGVQNARCPYTQKPLLELDRPVKDARGYVYEQEAVLAALAAAPSRLSWQQQQQQQQQQGGARLKSMPHPVAGVPGDLTEGELTAARDVAALKQQQQGGRGSRSEAAKFARDVRKCAKAGATAAAVRERQQRESAADEAKGAGRGGGKNKAPAGSGGVVALDDSDNDDGEAEAAAAAPPTRARSAELELEDELDEGLVIVDEDGGEDDEEAAAAAYLEGGGDDGDEEDAGAAAGPRGRPRRAAAKQRRPVVQSSSSEEGDDDDEDMIEDDDGAAARRQAAEDGEDDVLSA